MSTSPEPRRRGRAGGSRTGGAALAVVTVLAAGTLTGCVIGTVDDAGSAADSAVVTVTGGAPDPTDAQATDATPTDATDPGTGGPAVTVNSPYTLAYLDNGVVVTDGTLGTAAAWSTSKVPVAVAALRAVDDGTSVSDAATVQGNVTAAITASDNAAAEALWASLGDPETAGQKVEQVLRDGGDATTTVQTRVTRPGFTSFGQTLWSVADQVRFAGGLSCLAGAQPVLDAMGQVVAGQDYGLGRLAGARFKGGWGPDGTGAYQVRQFGLVPGADGTLVPVAVELVSPDGSYESGMAALDDLVDQLSGSLASSRGVNSGTC